jgi:hypothetical protein
VIVVADRTGQLANRLFTFGHLIAFAAEQGVRIANPGFCEYADDFPSFANDALCRWPRARIGLPRRLGEKAFFRTVRLREFAERRGRPIGPFALLQGEVDLGDPLVARLARSRRLLLVAGWELRDEAAFSRQRSLLCDVFKPARHHIAAALEARSKAVDSPRVVGLHIRRGDYEHWREGRFFWPAAVYAGIVERLRALPSRPAVLACSDDPAVLDELGGKIVRGPGSAVADLCALSLCDAIVGPPSTFSGWAAFQGGIRVRYLERPDEPLDDLDEMM